MWDKEVKTVSSRPMVIMIDFLLFAKRLEECLREADLLTDTAADGSFLSIPNFAFCKKSAKMMKSWGQTDK